MPKPRAPFPPGTAWFRWTYVSDNPASTGHGQSRLVNVRCSGCGTERSAYLSNLKADKVACPCPRPPRRRQASPGDD
jgi:ribosomal protein S27E